MFGEMQDTSPEQRRRYFERLARLTPAQRAALVAATTRRMRTLLRAGILRLHPGASEQEVRARVAVRLYGREVAQRLFGDVPADAR